MQLLVFATLVVAAASAPQNYNANEFVRSGLPKIRILSQRFDQDPDTGSYEYSYEQDNGQAAAETGQVYPGPQPETGSLTQQGSYQFVGDDGNTYQFVFATLVVAAAAAPQNYNANQFVKSGLPEIRILSQRFDQDPNTGNYEYSYEQDNGQAAAETGQVYPGPVPETGSITQQGNYQFVGDDGSTYQIPEYEQLRIEHPELFWAEQRQYA
ncbi:uncharacterized protein LOC119111163 [Pollicipes pollicipes]|uniref:uncharacterized protein LOC119111163 n=1 Tax=Pollicipes pollicipes TaxID=41117 RepID=UPI0018858404|nr:uncharacterized protein LOC119111163 [Pollicipes pollicipes]